MRVLVAGMIAGDPGHGGATWAVLQYVRGLERLGHQVLVVEPIAELQPESVSYFGDLDLARAGLLVCDTDETVGLTYERTAAFDAELLINISGMLRDPNLTTSIPTRVFLDLDPVFAQLWHAQGIDTGLDSHTHHVTVGGRLEESGIPLDRRWIHTLPPVVLEEWEFAEENAYYDAFTTVGNWRSYGSVEWNGTFYGQKAHAMRRLLELPGLTDEELVPALAIDPAEEADLQALDAHGWRLVDPAVVAGTPADYRRFVSGSKGELGVAKAGYVDSRCGWFSDRSACYLAAGRPVVAQDTGFSDVVPTGEGVLTFETVEEAATAIDRVCVDYERHRAAARAIAEEYLDSDLVLAALLEAVL